MRKLKLTVEYDGTDFAGFQMQAPGVRTVQSELAGAIQRITGAEAIVHAAGRTDAGVHALGQVAHFATESQMSASRIESALNAVLPSDVNVREVSWAGDEFHARFSAVRRTYLYLILNRPARSAVWHRYSVHEPKPLNIDAMRAVARVLTGTNNFSSFAASGGNPGSSYIRRVERLQVRRVGNGELIAIRCTANAFLRSMVRNFAGMLMAAGHGGIDVDGVLQVLAAQSRLRNPCKTAPARGLCLLRVDYTDLLDAGEFEQTDINEE